MLHKLPKLFWLLLITFNVSYAQIDFDPALETSRPVNRQLKDVWFKSLYDNLGGDNWNYKSFNEIFRRTEAPYFQRPPEYLGANTIVFQMELTIQQQRRPVSLGIVDLSGNNLVGKLEDHGDDWLYELNPGEGQGINGRGGRFYAFTRLHFSYNHLTEVTATLVAQKATYASLGSLYLDHNEITKFDPKTILTSIGQNGIGGTLKLNNNRLNDIPDSWQEQEIIPFINQNADEFDVSNNYLNFKELKKLDGFLQDYFHKLRSNRYDKNFDMLTYAPQKPLGDEVADKNLSVGSVTNVSFDLPDSDNQYYWELNGKKVPLSDNKDYNFTVNTATTGVYRCIVTNPALPELKIQSKDQAVFLQKSGNQNPSDFTLSNTSMPKNTFQWAVVGSFSGNDPDGDEVYYRLKDTGYKDNSSFRIQNGNTLVTSEEIFIHTFKTEYTILVEAYDIYGGKFEQEIIITRGNPTIPTPTDIKLANNTIEENLIDEVGEIQLVGVDIADYDLILPVALENAFFEIEGNKLKTKIPLNFEAKEEYPVRITATSKDGQVSLTKDLIVKATDKNDAPNNLLLSTNTIVINKAPGTFIGVLVATDDDPSDTDFTYELTSDDFTIENNNQLQSKRTFVNSDIGTKSITVTVTDPHGANREFTLDIEIEDEPLPAGAKIVLDNDTVIENSTGLVGKLSVDQDPTGTFTYELVSGFGAEDNSKFTIIGNELRLNSSVDYEAQSALTIRVKNDATPAIEHSLIINIENVNEAPTDIAIASHSLTLNTAGNTDIAKLVILDEDGDKGIFTIKSDLDADYFTLNNDVLRTAKTLDKNEYSINVIGFDGQFSVEKELQIYAKGSNTPNNTEPTSIGVNNVILASSFTTGVVVTELFMKDADKDSATFIVDGGTDADFFEVDGQFLKLKKDLDPNHTDRYEVTVRANDESGNSISQDLEFYIHSDALLGNTDLASLQDDLVYPNPVQNDLNIRLDNNLIERFTLIIVNITGQVIYTEDFDKTTTVFEKQLNVGNYAKGVYFLQLKSASSTQKVVKFLKE